MKFMLRPAVAAVAAFAAWSGHLYLIPAALFFVVAWATAPTRLQAWLTALAYYLVASRCIPQLGANFFADSQPAFVTGAALWIIAGLVLSGTWAVVWGKDRRHLRTWFAFLLLTVPPIGIISWTSPLAAAGVLYPGWGFLGLVPTSELAAVSTWESRYRLPCMAALLAAAIGANLVATPAATPDWIAVNTHLGSGRDLKGEYTRLTSLNSQLTHAIRSAPAGQIVLLPEAIVTDWAIGRDYLGRSARLSQDRAVTVLVGAMEPIGHGIVRNGLYQLQEPLPSWESRVPLPAGNWRPFGENSVSMRPFQSGITELGGKRFASLICFEQLLAWPALLSYAAGADAVLAPSNLWFAQESSLQGIQHTTAQAWARLFKVPVLFAVNH